MIRTFVATATTLVCSGIAVHPCNAQQIPIPAPSSSPIAEIGRVRVASKTHHALSTLPVQADLIGSRQIQTTPGRTLESSLSAIPGYAQASTSSWHLGPHSNYAELRGLGPGSVLVTFDGVPLNDPLGSWVTWGRVPKLLVDSIEAAHGGASALYGSQAQGGAIAIESVHPARDAIAYDAFTGNLASGTAFGVDKMLGGGWGASAYADRDYDTGYIRGAAPNTNSPIDPYSRYVGQRYRVQVAHGEPSSGFLEFGASGNDEHRSGDFTGPTWYYGKTVFARYRKDGASASFEGVAYLSNDAYTFNRFYGPGGLSGYNLTGFGEMSLDTAGLLTSTSRKIGATTLTFGADGRNVAGNRNEPRFSSPTVFIDGLQQFGGTFLQADTTFGRNEIITGARYDAYTQRQAEQIVSGSTGGTTSLPSSANQHLSPRIAYRYAVSPHWTARASFGDAFKAPDWGALYSTYPIGGNANVVGNPLLKAQTTDQTDGGIEWNPDARTRVYAALYSAVENGRIVQTQVSPTLYTGKNVSQARSGGYEFSLQRQCGDHVTIKASYANSPTRISNDTPASAIGNLIPSTPVSTGYLSARWFDATTSVEAEVRSLGRANADEQNTQQIDGAALFNVSASRSLGKAGEIYLEALNVFNRQWLAEATTYAPPRAITIGLRRTLR